MRGEGRGGVRQRTLTIFRMPLDLLQTIKRRKPEYVLIDAAQDQRILPFLAQNKTHWRSLYEGDTAYKLASHAPYLAVVPDTGEWISELLQNGWGRSWLVFLSSELDVEAIHTFAVFFTCKTLEGEQLYFRFYDPRILRAFLPACTPAELVKFFGPINQFILEGDLSTDLCVLSLEQQRLHSSTAAVSLLCPAGAG